MTTRRKPHAVAAAEDALIRCVRAKGRVARGELAGELGLVASTIGVYVERLVRDGFLIETIASDRGLGRPPVLLELNPRRGRFLGVDFDSQEVKGISVDFSQTPMHRVQRSLTDLASTANLLEAFESVIAELIGESTHDILGIGLGLPGQWDPLAEKRLQSADSEIDARAITDTLQARFQVPITVENNLRSIALAEYWFGRGRDLPRMACLAVRSSMGLGLVFDGKLYRGATRISGNIGQWICPTISVRENQDGPPTITGSSKVINEMSSIRGLLAGLSPAPGNLATAEDLAPASPLAIPTYDEFLERIAAGDPQALDCLQKVAVQHGWILLHLSLVVDPDIFVLAGPLTELPQYMEWVQQTCMEVEGPSLSSRLFASNLGPFGGALGAAAVAVHYWTPRGSNSHGTVQGTTK